MSTKTKTTKTKKLEKAKNPKARKTKKAKKSCGFYELVKTPGPACPGIGDQIIRDR